MKQVEVTRQKYSFEDDVYHAIKEVLHAKDLLIDFKKSFYYSTYPESFSKIQLLG